VTGVSIVLKVSQNTASGATPEVREQTGAKFCAATAGVVKLAKVQARNMSKDRVFIREEAVGKARRSC
jgi:hypothetical protein